jgi:hypothetical protein
VGRGENPCWGASLFVLPVENQCNDQGVDCEMGGTCRIHSGNEKYMQCFDKEARS